jgi:hypothetical protein
MDTTTNRENFHIPQQSTEPAEHLLATRLDEISRMCQEAYDVATHSGAIDPSNPENDRPAAHRAGYTTRQSGD